jgi:hypothetical protein
MVESDHHKGEMKMSIFEDTDAINAFLNQLADDGAVEPMIEPIDDPSVQVDFWDWADTIGIVDEFEPQTMVDADGFPWYVY